MATTTNFGWETPDDTDLVKDGALAMRTLGNAIDTSLVDLKGGTTGQILSKTSNTDMDFTWITNDVGDITAVTAGTGISGGGTTGAVTITNSMATAIDAKGDLIAGTGADTFDRLAIGSNNQVLTADSAAATGMKWASVSAPTAVSCYVKNTNAQTITSGSYQTLTFDAEYFDTDNIHSTSSNTGRLTVPSGLGGKWLVTISLNTSTSVAVDWYTKINVNGNEIYRFNWRSPGASENMNGNLATALNLSAGDYVEATCYQASGNNQLINTAGLGHFGISRLGA
jgi:hypothetical protein